MSDDSIFDLSQSAISPLHSPLHQRSRPTHANSGLGLENLLDLNSSSSSAAAAASSSHLRSKHHPRHPSPIPTHFDEDEEDEDPFKFQESENMYDEESDEAADDE